MESDVTQSADIYRLVAWAHANRTKLITITVAVAVVGLGIGVYVWNNNRHETRANEAKSALARLYLVQGKPEMALKLYEDLAKGRNNDSWSAEAEIQASELLAKYPNLKPKPAPAPVVAPTVTPGLPVATGTSAPAASKATTGIPLTITNKP